jgi:hypothetical protein
MTCEDAQLLIGADPQATGPEVEEHLRGCAACRGWRAEMCHLDAGIRQALAQPPDFSVPRPARQRPAWREYALAASVTLAMAAGLGVWLLRPSDSLAREVVAHVKGEPNSWVSTHVDPAALDHALKRSGVGLDLTSDRIVYVQSCWFRGHYVPHLVVETTRGPATVLILRHEQLRSPEEFHESGMSGVIVPDGDGSIAVVIRGQGRVDDVAGELRQDVHWLPEPATR